MGVRGLKSLADANGLLENYVFAKSPTLTVDPGMHIPKTGSHESLPRSDSKCQVSESAAPFKLVIDGRSLLHFLYRSHFDCVVGGQYSAYRKVIEEFIISLRKFKFEIVGVVVDESGFTGAMEFRDFERSELLRYTKAVAHLLMRLQHRAHRLHGTSKDKTAELPPLCLSVFIDTLKALDVPVYLTQMFNDQGVATLAKNTDSFVLSEDTDYMIYPLSTGYLPLSEFNLHTGKCKVFRVAKLCQFLDLPADFLPLYAAAAGPRYFEFKDLKSIYGAVQHHCLDATHRLVLPVLQMLKHLPVAAATEQFLKAFSAARSVFPGPSHEEWIQRFAQIQEIYSLKAEFDALEPDPELGPYGYTRQARVCGLFFCDVVLEDLARAPAWELSRPLRKIAYAQGVSHEYVHELLRTQDGGMVECPVRVSRKAPASDLLDKLMEPGEGDALVFALQFLVELEQLSLGQLMAFVLAATVPVDLLETLELHLDVGLLHAIACLETTMVSWSMATRQGFRRVLDVPPIHYFYQWLDTINVNNFTQVMATLAQDHVNESMVFLKCILGEDLDMSKLLDAQSSS